MTRKVLNFIKSPTGRFILFFLAVVLFALAFKYYKSLPVKLPEKTEAFHDVLSIEREYERFRNEYQELAEVKNSPIKTKEQHEIAERKKENDQLAVRLAELERALLEEQARQALKEVSEKKKSEEKSKAPENSSPSSYISPNSPVSLYSSKEVYEKTESKNSQLSNYAPYGRLIKCQLVNTVDSSSFETPVIALVTENLWHDGRIIIPAGTEVHGKAASLTQRNRIAAEKEWVLVWRTRTTENGFELPVTAVALDYNQDIKTGRYAITDGSAGLRGDVIQTDEYSKLKLYAALFIKGAAEGVSELILEKARSDSQNTYVNSDQSSSENNRSSGTEQIKAGVAGGVSQAVDLYAKNILEAVSRDGVFVRVPAGRFFYLYITQTIDKAKASPGAAGGGVEKISPLTETAGVEEAQKTLLNLAVKRLRENTENQQNGEKTDD